LAEVSVSPYVLGAVNLAVILALAPLLDGIQRKVAARLHSRIGPPVTQGYRDLIKLFRRAFEEIPKGSLGLYSLAPALLLGVSATTAFLTPSLFTEAPPISDLILVAYLLALGEALTVLTSYDTSNPFAVLGCGRKALPTLLAEVSFMAAAFSIVIKPYVATTALYGIASRVSSGLQILGSPSYYIAFAAALMALAAGLELSPYDVGVAEQEILGGVEVEYGGRGLGFVKYAQLVRRLAFMTLFIDVFIPWGMAGDPTPASVAVAIASYLLKTLAIFAAASLLFQSFSRFRVRGATRSLLPSLTLAFMAVILSSMGV